MHQLLKKEKKMVFKLLFNAIHVHVNKKKKKKNDCKPKTRAFIEYKIQSIKCVFEQITSSNWLWSHLFFSVSMSMSMANKYFGTPNKITWTERQTWGGEELFRRVKWMMKIHPVQRRKPFDCLTFDYIECIWSKLILLRVFRLTNTFVDCIAEWLAILKTFQMFK